MTVRKPADFKPKFDKELVADLGRVEQALNSHTAQVVDVRPAARFRGEAPEPREGVGRIVSVIAAAMKVGGLYNAWKH
jgi:3-mercaptopyruvate sulfurtransferase SseA